MILVTADVPPRRMLLLMLRVKPRARLILLRTASRDPPSSCHLNISPTGPSSQTTEQTLCRATQLHLLCHPVLVTVHRHSLCHLLQKHGHASHVYLGSSYLSTRRAARATKTRPVRTWGQCKGTATQKSNFRILLGPGRLLGEVLPLEESVGDEILFTLRER